MSPKLSRLLFVAALVTGAGAPMFSAYAAGQNRSVDAFNLPRGFEVPGKPAYAPLEINKDDTVRWNIMEGEHTVKPKDRDQWGGTGSDGNLTPESAPYTKRFTTPGDYFYFCDIHGGVGQDGNLTGMWGVIHVNDTTPTTQPPATQPPATQPPATQPPPTPTTATTRPSATPPATTATAPTTRPTPTTAAPTTTAPKGDKDKKPKDETTTTTVPPLTPPPPPPIDLPDEAIVPSLPSAGTTSNGAPGEVPLDTPEGEAVALLKGKKNRGGDAKKLLIVSGLGLGLLGFGTAGYKYANRSSKYFPA